jgi:secondary thiamine-phosphate synthase enzyme
MQTLTIRTSKRIELINITSQVEAIVKAASISEGLVLVYTPHTTTGLLINENEPRLLADIEKAINSLIPWDAPYRHNQIDNNAPSHIVGALLGCSVILPISDGQLSLGTWQSIFLVELDGPRSRRIKVSFLNAENK